MLYGQRWRYDPSEQNGFCQQVGVGQVFWTWSCKCQLAKVIICQKKKKSGSISWRWEASAQALWTQLCFLVSISTYKPKLFESHWNSTAIKSWGVNSTLPACKLQMSMLIEVCHSWQKKEILLHEAFIKANKPVNGHFSLETLQTPSCTRVSLSRRCVFWHSFFRSLVPDPV